MSSTWEPPLNCPFVKSAGRIGNFRSSLSWSADGPSPRPVSPWHSQHLALTYSSLPRARSSGVAGGGGGSTTGGSGFSSFHRGERVLMYVMTANRSLSGSSCHVGIAVMDRKCRRVNASHLGNSYAVLCEKVHTLCCDNN